MTDQPAQELYENSRRLLGPNRHFAEPGAVLDALPPACRRPELLERWRGLAIDLRDALGWPPGPLATHSHAAGVTLALAAPIDQLETACDVNEIAWLTAAREEAFDKDAILAELAGDSEAERLALLPPLIRQAAARGLPLVMDDDDLTIGIGAFSQSWPRAALPTESQVDWQKLADAPVIVVTGTNGKTTTVRLCARLAAAAGYQVGYNCTEGVVVEDQVEILGDYAGPDGARRVLRHKKVTFAVLEVARGGILRRGMAVNHAKAAIVTNISPDHFGEYGIDTLEHLADAKLSVAKVLDRDGMLVINADDALLLARAPHGPAQLGLFALDFDHPALMRHRAALGATCGVSEGRLLLCLAGVEFDLGAIAAMPLTAGAAAAYNIANIAASALAAAACGIAPDHMAGVLGQFGASRRDNPGRLERWTAGGVEILLDYAHNPDGMTALLAVAQALRGDGRMGLILGQAGNRSDQDIRELGRAAAAARPDLILLKDEPGMLRGREPGDVPALLQEALAEAGLEDSKIRTLLDEFDAACCLLAWARPGDVVVLSAHGKDTRPRLRTLLDMIELVSKDNKSHRSP